jgi:hypothetical protein
MAFFFGVFVSFYLSKDKKYDGETDKKKPGPLKSPGFFQLDINMVS